MLRFSHWQAILLAITLAISGSGTIAQTTQTYLLDTASYDIRGLIVDVEDPVLPPEDEDGWPTDPGAANRNAGPMMGRMLTGAGRPDAAKERIVENLIQRIRAEVEPGSWKDGGAGGPFIHDVQGHLVINQTPEAHEKIRALIKQILEAGAVQVTVETRFITGNLGLDDSKWIKAADHQRWPTTLDSTEVSELLRTVQQTLESTILTSPRLTLFDGQRAFVVVANETAYVADILPKVGEGGVMEYEPIVKTISSGVSLDMRATASKDHKSVDLDLRPRLRKLISMDAVPFNADGKQVGFVQVPTRAVVRINTLATIPNGQTLLLRIDPRVVPEKANPAPQPATYLLIKPTVVLNGVAAAPVLGPIQNAPARGNTP